jgi:hypothetical protein
MLPVRTARQHHLGDGEARPEGSPLGNEEEIEAFVLRLLIAIAHALAVEAALGRRVRAREQVWLVAPSRLPL